MLQVLEERRFPVTELLPVASERSIGKKVRFMGKDWDVMLPADAVAKKPVLAIFSAGGSVSAEWAPKFAAVGCRVVDNSSYWRMDPTKKLVVPEINADVLSKDDYIIANPNCSTIQMVLPLAPLHKAYGIKRIVVSTYQSVTGTGQKGLNQLNAERAGKEWGSYPAVYPCPIEGNVLPHILADVRRLMAGMPGVVVQDDPANNVYPMPINAWEKDEVFVGRLRRDESVDSGINLWCVSDNLRKGAATNAVQIAQVLLEKGFIA